MRSCCRGPDVSGHGDGLVAVVVERLDHGAADAPFGLTAEIALWGMATTIYSTRDGQKFSGDTTLVVVTCYRCHIPFAIPESLNQAALKHRGPGGWQFTCPMGHSQHYVGKTEEEKLRQRLGWARDDAARHAAERDQANAHLRGERAAKTRIRNDRDRIKASVAAGVCPCCDQSFEDLRRHMEAEHPDFELRGPHD